MSIPDMQTLVNDRELREAINTLSLDSIANSLQQIANAFEHGGNTNYGLRVYAPEVENMLNSLKNERNGL